MHFCESCLVTLLQDLSIREKAILVYLFAIKKEQKDDGKADVRMIAKAIQNMTTARRALELFLKLSLVKRRKEDHTWKYSLSSEGELLVKKIQSEKEEMQRINTFFTVERKGN